MKKNKLCLLTITASICVAAVQGQTVDDIISKHIDALGGKDKLSQVTSLYVESTVNAMGNDNQSKTYIVNAKDYKIESDFNGQQFVQCYTADHGGWVVNPMAGQTTPTAMPDNQYKPGKVQMHIPDQLFNYAEKGSKAELQGTESVDSINAYKIKLTNADSIETTYYIDPTTYYIIKSVSSGEMMGQPVEIINTYSNYQKTDFGLVVPYLKVTDFSQFSITVTVKKVEVNKQIDPAIFDMPKP
ncbi:MAG TPA: hypothetical protein VH396_14650 [Chitinophagaceae bacterium]